MFERDNFQQGQNVTYQHKIETCNGDIWETVTATVVSIYGHTMLMDNGDKITVI